MLEPLHPVGLLAEDPMEVLNIFLGHLFNLLVLLKKAHKADQELLAMGDDTLYLSGFHEGFHLVPVFAEATEPFKEAFVLIRLPLSCSMFSLRFSLLLALTR
uniref:Uncharacterized protein n=1 Tax=Strombidium inclinatum TaxID=197538 RepID=A0A7S3IT25_9SPIT